MTIWNEVLFRTLTVVDLNDILIHSIIKCVTSTFSILVNAHPTNIFSSWQ